MADNRTRKLDRKAIKRLQKAIRKVDEEITREIETHPDGHGSPRLFDLNDRKWELDLKLQRISQQMDDPGEWDDTAHWMEVCAAVRKDREKKLRRAEKRAIFDEVLEA